MGRDLELTEACKKGDLGFVQNFFSQQKRALPFGGKVKNCVGYRDANGFTPLHHAALQGHREIVSLLLASGASLTARCKSGCLPLHLASFANHKDIVKLLLSHDAARDTVNAQNNSKDTSLHYAAQHGHEHCINVLLQYGADPGIRNEQGETALDLACRYGRERVVHLLVTVCPALVLSSVAAPGDSRRPPKFSPLHIAARNGKIPVMKILLDVGFDINFLTEEGSALHTAALHGRVDVVKFLLSRGIDPGMRDYQGRTALDMLQSQDAQYTSEITQLIQSRPNWGQITNMIANHQPAEQQALKPDKPPRGVALSAPSKFARNNQIYGNLGQDVWQPVPENSRERLKCERYEVPPSPLRIGVNHSRTNGTTSGKPPVKPRRHFLDNLPCLQQDSSSEEVDQDTLAFADVMTTAVPATTNHHSPPSPISTISLSTSRSMNGGGTSPFPLNLDSCNSAASTPLPGRSPVHNTFNNSANRMTMDAAQHSTAVPCRQTVPGTCKYNILSPQGYDNLTAVHGIGPPVGTAQGYDNVLSKVVLKGYDNMPSNMMQYDNAPKDQKQWTHSCTCDSIKKDLVQMRQVETNSSLPYEQRHTVADPAMYIENRPLPQQLIESQYRRVQLVTYGGQAEQLNTAQHHQDMLEDCIAEEVSDEELAVEEDDDDDDDEVVLRHSDPQQTVADGPGDSRYLSALSNLVEEAEDLDVSDEIECLPSDTVVPDAAITPDVILSAQLRQQHEPNRKTDFRRATYFVDQPVFEHLNKFDNAVQEFEAEITRAPLAKPESTNLSDMDMSNSGGYPRDSVGSSVTSSALLQNSGGLLTPSEPPPPKWVSESIISEKVEEALSASTVRQRSAELAAQKERMDNSTTTEDSTNIFDEMSQEDMQRSFSQEQSSYCSECRRNNSHTPTCSCSSSCESNTPSRDIDITPNNDESSPTMTLSHPLDTTLSLTSPIDETEEWQKIDDIMAQFGKVETPKQRKLRQWFEQVHMEKYHDVFVSNGFDCVDFLFLVDKTVLRNIGISDQQDIEVLLRGIQQLDGPGRLSAQAKTHRLISDWLSSLDCEALYLGNFMRAGYDRIDTLNGLSDDVMREKLGIEPLGHRLRLLWSLRSLDFSTTPFGAASNASAGANLRHAKAVAGAPRLVAEHGANLSDATVGVSTAQQTHAARSVSEMALSSGLQLSTAPGANLPKPRSCSYSSPDLMCSMDVPENPTTGTNTETLPERPESLSSSVNQSSAPSDATSPTKLPWRHSADELIYNRICYSAHYLGSNLMLGDPNGPTAAKEAIVKLKKSTREMAKMKFPQVNLQISYRSVRIADATSHRIVCEHDVQNIICVRQDDIDYNCFVYVSKEGDRHFCHVFSVLTTDLANEVILTLGQAFEVAYDMAIKEASKMK